MFFFKLAYPDTRHVVVEQTKGVFTVPSRLSISSWRSASTIEGKQSESYSLDGCQMLHYGARFSVRVSDPLDTAVPLATLRALPNLVSVAGIAFALHFNLYVVSERFDGMLLQHAWFSSTRRQGYFFDNMSYSARSRLQDYARDCSALCDFHARISQAVGADVVYATFLHRAVGVRLVPLLSPPFSVKFYRTGGHVD